MSRINNAVRAAILKSGTFSTSNAGVVLTLSACCDAASDRSSARMASSMFARAGRSQNSSTDRLPWSAFGIALEAARTRIVLIRLFCRFKGIVKNLCRRRLYRNLIDWAEKMFGYTVEIIKRSDQNQFKILSKRWIVERTFAWLNWSRRLSKDYELRHTSAETMIHIAFVHQLLRRST
jgi:hypothetical protein